MVLPALIDGHISTGRDLAALKCSQGKHHPATAHRLHVTVGPLHWASYTIQQLLLAWLLSLVLACKSFSASASLTCRMPLCCPVPAIQILQGDNAWVFVHEDDIPDTVKHWNSFSEELLKDAKAAAPKGVEPAPPTTLTAIVMDSKALSPAEVRDIVCMVWQLLCSGCDRLLVCYISYIS
jgi:hypothetical protein